MSETLSLVLQGGAVAVLLLGFGALLRGDLRTKQEVEGQKLSCDNAQKTLQAALDRANTQVDTLMPAMRELTATVGKQNDMLENLIDQLADEVTQRSKGAV